LLLLSPSSASQLFNFVPIANPACHSFHSHTVLSFSSQFTMFSRLFIAILGFAIALCQASDGSYQPTPQHFKYWGCATVDAAGFSNPVPLPNGVLTPEMCNAACAYHMFAAVSPG
jgi:hypothetical protein